MQEIETMACRAGVVGTEIYNFEELATFSPKTALVAFATRGDRQGNPLGLAVHTPVISGLTVADEGKH